MTTSASGQNSRIPRAICRIFAIATLGRGPGFAQTPRGYDGNQSSAPQTSRRTEVPIDHGPFTSEANRAFQGGGMVLQGAPGAPPPRPEPTPPGQVPRNMVPPSY
jgi:hypothetical protein